MRGIGIDIRSVVAFRRRKIELGKVQSEDLVVERPRSSRLGHLDVVVSDIVLDEFEIVRVGGLVLVPADKESEGGILHEAVSRNRYLGRHGVLRLRIRLISPARAGTSGDREDQYGVCCNLMSHDQSNSISTWVFPDSVQSSIV